MAENETVKTHPLFPVGAKNDAYQKYFIGQSYVGGLVSADDNIDVNVANVTFEPGCRNNWHVHHGFQILLVTGGKGWYQEEGQPAQRLHPGDTVAIHDGVKHWHGATKDSWFAHVAIGQGTTDWFEPVTDEEYAKLG